MQTDNKVGDVSKLALLTMRKGGTLWIDRLTGKGFYGDYNSIGADDINTLIDGGFIERGRNGRLSDFYKLTELGKTIKLIPNEQR